MKGSCHRIGEILLRVQNLFLEHPPLKVTPFGVQTRLGLDAVSCRAALNVLADSGVVTRTGDGRYARFFPRPASTSVRRAATDQARRSLVPGSYGGAAA